MSSLPPQLLLPFTLCEYPGSLKLQALIDYGAEQSFNGADLVTAEVSFSNGLK